MLLPDWIQLFRNGFCVLRALAPRESALFKVHFPQSAYPLSAVDYAIVATQIPPVYYFGKGALSSLSSSSRNSDKYRNLLMELDQVHFEDFETQDGVGPETVTAVLRHGLTSELAQSKRQMKVGVSQGLIAVAFLFLSLNTLQIRFPSHPSPVVNAVISMLTGLSYLLYTMVLSLITRTKNVDSARRLRRSLKKSPNGNSPSEVVSLAYRSGYGEDLMEALTALTASKQDGSSTFNFQYKSSGTNYSDMVYNDLHTIRNALLALRDPAAGTCAADGAEETPQRVTRSRAKSSTAAQAVSPGVLVSLDARKREQIVSGLTTLAFFLLNFGAGYSYLMCVLAFYAPHESFGGDSIIGAAVSLLMFNQPSAVADWWGGLLGDLFWTIEPVLVLASPYLTKFLYKVCIILSFYLSVFFFKKLTILFSFYIPLTGAWQEQPQREARLSTVFRSSHTDLLFPLVFSSIVVLYSNAKSYCSRNVVDELLLKR